ERRRNRALRAAVRPLGRRLREARSLDEVWSIVEQAAGLFGASGIRVDAGSATMPPGMQTTFARGIDGAGDGDGERARDGDGGGPDAAVAAAAGEATPRDEHSAVFQLHFAVPGGRAGEGGLDLLWSDGRREIDRDTEIAIDMLCEYLGEAFEIVRTI